MRGRMDREAHGAAMPDRVDLRQVVRLANEGVVFRNAAVVVQAQHFAGGYLRVLCVIAARGNPEHIVGRDRD